MYLRRFRGFLMVFYVKRNRIILTFSGLSVLVPPFFAVSSLGIGCEYQILLGLDPFFLLLLTLGFVLSPCGDTLTRV